MRVDTERSRNEYRVHHGRKYDERLKRRNYRTNNNNYHSRSNENHSSRVSLKSRHHYEKDYSSSHISSPSSNRINNSQTNYYPNHSSASSRFDRQTNNRDIYSPLLNDQPILSGGPPPAALYYNSSQSIRDRGLPSHYIDSERNRYSSSTYRRDTSPPPPPPPPPPSSSSSYRNDYIPRSNSSDLYIHDEYRSPTPPILTPLSTRSTVDPYNDMYRASDYNNRTERYDIAPNRNGSSRDYSITSVPSPVYRSDPYRTSSVIPMSSPPLSSSSSYVTRDQYVQPLPPMREVDYRTRDYGMTTSMDHRQIISNYHNDYRSSSSHRDRSNLKRSRSDFNENRSKRPMRR